MRKMLFRTAIVCLSIFLLLLTCSVWVFGTSSGAKWLLKTIAGHYSLSFEVGQVNGRLWDTLSMKGLKIGWRTGSIEASHFMLDWKPLKLFSEKNIVIRKLELSGKNISLSAEGDLEKRMNFLVDVDNLAGILNDAAGTLSGEGWIRKKTVQYEGTLSLQFNDLSVLGISAKNALIQASLASGETQPIEITGGIEGLEYGVFHVQTAQFNVDGTVDSHTIEASFASENASVHLISVGSYESSTWNGVIQDVQGNDAVGPWFMENPTKLKFSSGVFQVQSLVLRGARTESISIDVLLDSVSHNGTVLTRWDELNLRRWNQWLTTIEMSGRSSGKGRAEWEKEKVNSLQAHTDSEGKISTSSFTIDIRKAHLSLEGGPLGLQSSVDIELSQEGKVKGSFNSPSPAHFGIPGDGTFSVSWQKINVSNLSPLLPGDLRAEGALEGSVQGKLVEGSRFQLSGKTTFSDGFISHTFQQKSQIGAKIRTADLSYQWKGSTLTCSLNLIFAGRGNVKAEVELPLLARLPVSLNRSGEMNGRLEGDLVEKGLLSIIFPGVLQESNGDFMINIAMKGTLENPQFYGNMRFSDASAYIPSAGIRVRKLKTEVSFHKDHIQIDSFSFQSGAGTLSGNAFITLGKWEITQYEGRIAGKNVQTVYLPHLHIVTSPNLSFTGSPDKLSVKGEINVPELTLSGQESSEYVQPSEDVVIIDSASVSKRGFPLVLDIRVHVVLGKEVHVRMEGIDARLTGDVMLTGKSLSDLKGKGLIRAQKGVYKRYGVNLDIMRGRIVFSGGPINNPTLDILAVRTVNDVRAGVLVTGTIQTPLVRLYSVPSMPDTDILAYIVLGRPMGGDREDVGLVYNAANMLLSQNESASLQEKIKDVAGLDVLEIQSGGDELSRSIVTIGKYLTPDLYISYGQSLLGVGDVFRMRYTISKRWEIETKSGTFSGVDLYFKMNFR